jgi:hypothetical protein
MRSRRRQTTAHHFADTLSIAIEKINLFGIHPAAGQRDQLLYETAIATSSVLDSKKLFSPL